MKDLWYAVCVGVYMSRFNLLAMVLVLGAWLVLAEWIVPPVLVQAVVYLCFGWFVLGKIIVPYVERKLEKLFD